MWPFPFDLFYLLTFLSFELLYEIPIAELLARDVQRGPLNENGCCCRVIDC